MFDERSSRKLPIFSDYLTKAHQTVQKDDSGFWGFFGCIVAPAVLVLAAVFLSQLIAAWLAVFLTVFVGSPLVFGALHRIQKKLQEPKTAEQQRKLRFRTALEKYMGPLSRKKLHRELDPMAGQLLEAAAFHYTRIVVGLNGPFWTSAELPHHWLAVRAQILEAADDAMEDATMLCADCIGKPPRSRKDDFRDAVEGFGDLAWVDALQQLGQVVSAKEDRYAYKSPQMGVIFEPVREIAEKLKLLAEEVERRSLEVSRESAAQQYPASDSIDEVLGAMRSLHEAEAELDQQQRLGGPG